MSAKPDWRYADDGRPRVPAPRSEGTDLIRRAGDQQQQVALPLIVVI